MLSPNGEIDEKILILLEMDGKDILYYFDGRIAAGIRPDEAINRKLLCPFQYFGVADSVDLSSLKWNRGGYDIGELQNVYTQYTKGMLYKIREDAPKMYNR